MDYSVIAAVIATGYIQMNPPKNDIDDPEDYYSEFQCAYDKFLQLLHKDPLEE